MCAAPAHFKPECIGPPYSCSAGDRVNSYDNSIVYTDHVLAGVIALLRKQKAIMFFTPDHGESLGEYSIFGHGWPTTLAPKAQMEVPMVVWASRSFRKLHPGQIARLTAAATGRPITHDNVFHTVLGCLGVESDLKRRDLDLCSPPP